MNDIERIEAMEFYVEVGLGINTIYQLFERKIKLRTLYQWRKEDDWDKLRVKYKLHDIPLKEELYQLVKTAIAQAKLNPTPPQISAVSKVLWALLTAVKEIKGNDILNDNSNNTNTISKTTIEKIEKEILGI